MNTGPACPSRNTPIFRCSAEAGMPASVRIATIAAMVRRKNARMTLSFLLMNWRGDKRSDHNRRRIVTIDAIIERGHTLRRPFLVDMLLRRVGVPQRIAVEAVFLIDRGENDVLGARRARGLVALESGLDIVERIEAPRQHIAILDRHRSALRQEGQGRM